jgi:pullulanase/glycogen debranching enzyme
MNVQEVQVRETTKYPEIWLGAPYPLGATWTEEAVNFALFSENAVSVDLCLFDSIDEPVERVRIPMTEQTDQVWHVGVPALQGSFTAIAPLDPTHPSEERASTAQSC